MASAITKSTVLLDRPSDWHDWLLLIQAKALQQDVEKYCNPDLAVEVVLPPKPTRPLPDNVVRSALSVQALNVEQRGIYRQLVDDYKIDLVEYTKRQKVRPKRQR